jgi:hypothetical protein
MMDDSELTCAVVDAQDLDTRYLAGRLTEEEAASFEAHYFGCDRCWALVRGGAAVAAARPRGPAIARTRREFPWRPLAMAAAIGLVAVGTWQVLDRGTVPRDVVRGAGDSIALRIESTAPIHLVWPADPRASSYRLRIFDEQGQLLFQRELSDTTWTASPTDSGSIGSARGRRLLEIEAFDSLRRPIVRSPLTPLRAPGDSI